MLGSCSSFLGMHLGHVTQTELTMLAQKLEKMKARSEGADTKGLVSQPSSEFAALRKSCSNQLHLALHVLGDPGNQQRARMLLSVSAPLRASHGKQAAGLRSIRAALEWSADLADGKGLGVLNEIAEALKDPSDLHYMGFCTSGGGALPTDGSSLMGQAFLAEQAGSYAVCLLAARMKTELQHCFGLPGRLALLARGADEADKKCMSYFKDCWEAFKAAHQAPSSKTAWWKKLL